jgi:epoxyqueuosine reductase
MENHFDKRLNPTLLVDGAKVSSRSIELLPRTTSKFGYFKISKYAYGADYHFVIKEKLKEFLFSIQSTIGKFQDVLCRFWPSTR